MSMIEKDIEVAVPARVAYNQWTQFEDFPHFMEGVQHVKQLDDLRLYWMTEIGGVHREWYAKISEQVPDEKIAWTAEGDIGHSGVVTFDPIDADRCRVTVQMTYAPSGFIERAGDLLGIVERRVSEDLERFKAFLEERGVATGAWRGEVRRSG